MIEDLPPANPARIQQALDRFALRLLLEELERDSADADCREERTGDDDEAER